MRKTIQEAATDLRIAQAQLAETVFGTWADSMFKFAEAARNAREKLEDERLKGNK